MNDTAVAQGAAPDEAELIRLMDYPDSTEEIPTLDIADYLAGKPGAKAAVAEQLGEITRTIGFFYLKGHGIPRDFIDHVFAESRRFHGQPLAVKKEVPLNDNVGYRHEELQKDLDTDNVNLIAKAKPDLLSTLTMVRPLDKDATQFMNKELKPQPFVWPTGLPGFKETMLDYQSRIEALGKKFLPLWAISLDLPENYFEPFFKAPQVTLQLLQYSPQSAVGNKQYGIAPHTDNAMMTFLAQSNVPGLAVRMPSGHWRMVDIRPDTLLVNTGNVICRWTNDRYLSTKHRVINRSGIERYSIPVFFGPDDDAVVETVPTCVEPGQSPRYEPRTYLWLRRWYYGYAN